MTIRFQLPVAICVAFVSALANVATAQQAPDFQREIRPILSNICFKCHGPDQDERKGGKKGSGGLRLDTEEGARADLDGAYAVVPGHPEKSELIARLISDDPEEVMPPPKSGKKLSAREVELLKQWITAGAKYAKHWSYEKPVQPAVPEIRNQKSEIRNPIDAFILARLEKEKLAPKPEADRYALIRRVSLDLTGLPPTPEETDAFVNDKSPDAYGKLVDRLLASPAYGEHWGRAWLDLARYADSAGYADDPPRTIWAYRDYVIRAFNANMPFDQFTIEQIAGDLLPNPTEEQLIATAFHRNTMTNNEGGTNDEEFRTAAIVDRANTTMSVWMGTSFACAQCHTHKYDPITNAEYFRLYAFLNNTEDADKKTESPVLEFFTAEKSKERAAAQAELTAIEKIFSEPTPTILAGLAKWEREAPVHAAWQNLRPQSARNAAGAELQIAENGAVFAPPPAAKTDTYTVELPLPPGKIEALRIEALADARLPGKGPGHSAGNFVLSKVRAEFVPETPRVVPARHLRIEKVGNAYDFLALAEVQIFSGTKNVALTGKANQISTDPDEPGAERAIDGNTNGDLEKGKSVSLTGGGEAQWWEVDLGSMQPMDRIVIWKRTDKGKGANMDHLKLTLLDEKMQPVWNGEIKKRFGEREEISVSGRREILFGQAFADVAQAGFDPRDVLAEKALPDKGWALAGFTGVTHSLTLLPQRGQSPEAPGRLALFLAQTSKFPQHTLGAFRVGATADSRIATLAGLPAPVVAALGAPDARRSPQQARTIRDYYARNVAPEWKAEQKRAVELAKQLAALKPDTVPIQRDLAGEQRRKTKVQLRGNYLSLSDEVTEGVPAAFHPLPKDAPMNRLTLARWLVDENNPLTARVIANRFWESIFGIGIVRTSEEFGAQGELPSHPELLDWLATELIREKWDVKKFLKLLVTSATYRQSSKVSPELAASDPDNRLLARGPRFRMSAEMVRDQALAVSGLLSRKMYGPSVRPARPSMGLSAAFGGGLDWQTSVGEDSHRRALYTEWRRTAPYPSMATFDAPNREVCTLRRNRSNTPLQALVTLNDPVYIEAAQALARRMVADAATPAERARRGFVLCLSRPPSEKEVQRLTALHAEVLAAYQQDPKKAADMATNPIGPVPQGADVADLAAWTTVANTLLNLDETVMKR